MKLENIKTEKDIKEVLIEHIAKIAKDPLPKHIKSYEAAKNYITQNHKFDFGIYNMMFKGAIKLKSLTN